MLYIFPSLCNFEIFSINLSSINNVDNLVWLTVKSMAYSPKVSYKGIVTIFYKTQAIS